jgi:hypothetical protein
MRVLEFRPGQFKLPVGASGKGIFPLWRDRSDRQNLLEICEY